MSDVNLPKAPPKVQKVDRLAQDRPQARGMPSAQASAARQRRIDGDETHLDVGIVSP